MRFVSIDLETTGLDEDTCQILEFGAVLHTDEFTPVEELPAFHCYVTHKQLVGDPFALALNHDILVKLAKPGDYPEYKYIDEVGLILDFEAWLDSNGITGKVVPAGKNFASFDKQFLKKLPNFKRLKLHHRTLDPAMYFIEPTDEFPPDTKTCMQRAGLPGEVAHLAIADAMTVIQLMRIGQQKIFLAS